MTTGQGKSHNKSSTYARLERLRLVTGKTWQTIADGLNLDRSMLFHVKSGTRNLSEKALFRLRQAELAAGIRYSARELVEFGLSPQQTADALSDREPVETDQFVVTSDDIDRGFAEIELKYKRGKVPKGQPERIRIKAPPNEQAWSLADSIGRLWDRPGPLLALCLPQAQIKQEFLDRLTPSSYKIVVEAAMALTFGLGWRDELNAG